MARQSVSPSTLAVLEAANLVHHRAGTAGRSGNYLNAEPINAIADRWISRYDQPRFRALADLKKALEETPYGQAERRVRDYISNHPPSGSGRR